MFHVRGSSFPLQSLSLYAPFPSDSATSYGPSHLGPSLPPSLLSFCFLLLEIAACSLFTSIKVQVYFQGFIVLCRVYFHSPERWHAYFRWITAFVPYVSEMVVSPLLDYIIVRWDHRTCESYSIQSLLLSSNLAFIPSLKLLFALLTKPFVCGCFTEAKSLSGYIVFYTQVLNGIVAGTVSLECLIQFPLVLHMGVLHVCPSSSYYGKRISFSFLDFPLVLPTSTCLLRCAKLVMYLCLGSAFLFSLVVLA
ncbi:hypothetical protein Tco_1184522 [Tanacetum coccineum]